MNRKLVFWLGILGPILFILATILSGLQLNGYSHMKQLISESYAIGSPYGVQLRFFGFIPSGICMFSFAFIAMKIVPKSSLSQMGFLGIGIFYGLATIVVSIFPCDEGCNKEMLNPTISQLIHNFSGLLTYLIVPLCLIFLGLAARKWVDGKLVSIAGILCGFIAIVFVGILSNDLKSNFAGLYQRIIEGSILLWIIICAVYLNHSYKHNQ